MQEPLSPPHLDYARLALASSSEESDTASSPPSRRSARANEAADERPVVLEDLTCATVVDFSQGDEVKAKEHDSDEETAVGQQRDEPPSKAPTGVRLALLMLTLVRFRQARSGRWAPADSFVTFSPAPRRDHRRSVPAPREYGIVQCFTLTLSTNVSAALPLPCPRCPLFSCFAFHSPPVSLRFLRLGATGLDNTIVATSTAEIANDFRALTDVGWCELLIVISGYRGRHKADATLALFSDGSAYLLTCVAFQPLFGRAYAFFPQKWVFLLALSIFFLGCIVAAVAPSSTVFILGRAIQGLGYAGMLSSAPSEAESVRPSRKLTRSFPASRPLYRHSRHCSQHAAHSHAGYHHESHELVVVRRRFASFHLRTAASMSSADLSSLPAAARVPSWARSWEVQ